jgi:hypothetical protein
MKIRNGFVSNSSSSSFVIRGLKFTDKELSDAWKLDEHKNLHNQIQDKCRALRLDCRDAGNYFSGESSGSFVIGIRAGELEDGDVMELSPDAQEDIKLQTQLEMSGLHLSSNLKYYVQYVSNDNY